MTTTRRCDGCGEYHAVQDDGSSEQIDPTKASAPTLLKTLEMIRADRDELAGIEAEVVKLLRDKRMPWAIIVETLGESESTLRRRHGS